jgi:hypothetical protein
VLVYSRTISKLAVRDAEANGVDLIEINKAHVRAHLSSVADHDDDPTTNADDVEITVTDRGDDIHIVGKLDAEPNAPYLREGYDPEKEAAEGR